MDKKEKEKCVAAMLLLNIAAWLLFLMMDAVAELLLDMDGILDGGFLTIPFVLTVLFIIFEKKLFDIVRFRAKYNLLLAMSFVLFAAVFGGIAWILCMEDIWLIPQGCRGFLGGLNGVEYLAFPFAYGIVSLILGFVFKLVSYILYRRKEHKSL